MPQIETKFAIGDRVFTASDTHKLVSGETKIPTRVVGNVQVQKAHDGETKIFYSGDSFNWMKEEYLVAASDMKKHLLQILSGRMQSIAAMDFE